MTRHLVLLGLMGAGKTSIGRIVAERLGLELVDGDEQLVALTGGQTAADVAAAEGIDHLHALEAELALRALDAPGESVIAPAASVCESTVVLDRLAGHRVVWLTAPTEMLAEKVAQKDHRPLVRDTDPFALLAEQRARREPLVLALDPLVIDVSTVDDETAADLVVAYARDHVPDA